MAVNVMNNEISLKEENKIRKGNQNDKLEKSFKNYKLISKKPANNKLIQLPFWLYKQSNILLDENNGKKQKIVKFKRGTIIVVDFGVKIGSELSNPHFAIVLTKEDTPYSKVITVLPLSSKGTKYNYPLNNLIYDEFTKHINKKINEFRIKCQKIANRIISVEYADILNKQKNKLTLTKEDKLLINKYTLYVKELEKLEEEMKKAKKVITFYKEHQKNTYACINQITTISKERIYSPINEYDIVGITKCSNELLNEIDSLIIKNYTGFNSNNDNDKEEKKELTFS